MSAVEIVHPVPAEEASGWITAALATLLQDTHESGFDTRVARWSSEWYPERTWGARDRGRWIGTLATLGRMLTVPGGGASTRDVLTDALTGVSVAATHHRRGLLTEMITESLADAKERGDALAVLIAAEWPIYGRFGYAPAAYSVDYVYRPRERGAGISPSAEGAVRQVEGEELVKYADAIFEAARRLRPGQIDRPGQWWARQFNVGFDAVGEQYHWFLHEGPDGPDGMLGWRVLRDFELDGSHGAIQVTNLVTGSDTAYRNLWSYLGNIDLVDEITVLNRPVDEPVRWLLPNGRALRQSQLWDFLWVALLDVPAALQARGYDVVDRLVLDVVDDSRTGYATGRFELDTSPDGATCRPTTASADLQLPARVLAAAYLGGHSVAALRTAGGVDEVTSGAVRRLDAMLATPLAPWCQTGF